MRIIAWTMTWWRDAEHGRRQLEGPFGLKVWRERADFYLKPFHKFVCTGNFSDPAHHPLPEVAQVQSGAWGDRPYDVTWWNYSGCVFTAAAAHGLNRNDWDLMVFLDNDMLIGAVDFDAVLREFLGRPEVMLNQKWLGWPGGPFIAWKRRGAALWLHQRRRANLMDWGGTAPPFIEEEMGQVYRGQWWTPWPQFESLRQDWGTGMGTPPPDDEVMRWPFVRLPSPTVIERYALENTSRARPIKN